MDNSISKRAVEGIYADLQKGSRTASVRTKLAKVNNACEKISANAVVTVASVIRYIAEDGVKLTKRTVYNDREGGNPYKILIEAWIKHSESIHSSKKGKSTKSNSETSLNLVNEEDLAKISDISLRHKFSLMYGELRSLRNQVNLLKDVGSLPVLSQQQIPHSRLDEGLLPYTKSTFHITEYDKEVIKDFLNPTLTSLGFDDDGSLISQSAIKRNETLSMEGFRDILERFLNA